MIALVAAVNIIAGVALLAAAAYWLTGGDAHRRARHPGRHRAPGSADRMKIRVLGLVLGAVAALSLEWRKS